ncbi:MAG TPA: bifunctional phosphoribosyl-AMP cyclohydrolase/phosphoribosyl-ATP diphosphatase HisIE [Candidatus Gastranaerophilales bacterium]|nr:bifunctional phosphoribosyl-AMP cyclohydrolase/phosphoribosyl-ATP diphosphatase HisIE [Candidatus Gastranaerophilales bacterium]
MIIPSIDLMNGKAVQLRQGKEKVLEREDVFELAKYFGRFGEIAVIDLDAAMGRGNNNELIKKLCKIADCRVGGGIRTIERAKEVLATGAKKIIVGTAASREFLSQLPKEKVIVAIDCKNGKVVTQGWLHETENTPAQIVKLVDDLCSGYLYTIVEKEGMMNGTDIDAILNIRAITDNPLVAAGGISSIDEIIRIDSAGAHCQLGMAIYTGEIKLENAFVELLDFVSADGLIPTIVQDRKSKQILMLAYSNEESVKMALETGKGTYFSRSRQSLWVKGETSGNTQELIQAKYDCDRDALLYIVDQKGAACHTGQYSCFEDHEFNFETLYDVLLDRLLTLPENSYTTKLFKDDLLLKRKINEEAFEVLQAKDKDELIWEICDLTYFVMTLMVKNGISINDLKNHLESRRK